MVELRHHLQKLIEAHGLQVFEDGTALGVANATGRVEAHVALEIPHPPTLLVQLDVVATPQAGVNIVESCAGMGATRDEAALNALHNFSVYSLHALLAAMWQVVEPSQVSIETWHVGGVAWQAFLGLVAMRHQAPDTPTLPPHLFRRLEDAIKNAPLAGDWNWFRWYCAHSKGSPPVFEALKNNEPWAPGIDAIQQLRWPAVENFWSARQFLILKRLS
jgi:hypothetical protein